jgi:hypothetical protein
VPGRATGPSRTSTTRRRERARLEAEQQLARARLAAAAPAPTLVPAGVSGILLDCSVADEEHTRFAAVDG